jgi:hypothetical protein
MEPFAADCPPGNKDNGGNSCVACGADFYCVGGVDNTNRGSALPCDGTSNNGLTTRGALRARGPAQCCKWQNLLKPCWRTDS